MLNRDEKQLKALHTRANLRRLLDYVSNGQVEKITKMCSKGLDPNFHCHETGGEYCTV
jgi:SH3/ankyrin repeat-containing protein